MRLSFPKLHEPSEQIAWAGDYLHIDGTTRLVVGVTDTEDGFEYLLDNGGVCSGRDVTLADVRLESEVKA